MSEKASAKKVEQKNKKQKRSEQEGARKTEHTLKKWIGCLIETQSPR